MINAFSLVGKNEAENVFISSFCSLQHSTHTPAQRLHDGDDEYDDDDEEDDDRNLICLDLNNDQDYKSMAKIRVLLENEKS